MAKKDNNNLYEQFSEERKELQAKGFVPEWMSTASWALFKDKYLYETDEAFLGQAKRIAKTAAKHMPKPEEWEPRFLEIIWKGWLSCATPVLANTGTNRGLNVSCSGTSIHDSIDGFYSGRHEVAILTKHGFGTSSYLGDVRPRGSKISVGGKASGSMPVVKGFVQDMRDVAQGTARRGAWAGYLPIDHGDFYEWTAELEAHPDDLNIGWNISNAFIERLNSKDQEAIHRYQRAMKVKMLTGKGYFYFIDKVNRANPKMYVDRGLEVLAGNLCTEITLASGIDPVKVFRDMVEEGNELTYTCVLSSMNLAKWEEWKNTDAVFVSTVFLDCMASEFIERARKIKGLEKAVRSTERGRAIGLGALGLHTLFQKKMLSFESFEAHSLNNVIFKHLHDESLKASQWLARELGEPEWCKGYGVRNTHRIAIAPNASSSILMGGISQGIEPIIGNAFVQGSAGGEFERVNPVFLELMKARGKFTKKLTDQIAENNGSVQDLDWLSEEEKKVFKTFYEIDQRAILRQASARQRWICQAQSLNLAFSAEEKEEYISEIHKEAFLDPNIKALYYLRSAAGVYASKGECSACEG